MNSTRLSKMLDTFFTTLALMLLFFAIFRSKLSVKAAIILASILSLATSFVIHKIKNRRLKKHGIKTKDLKHAQDVLQTLYVSPKNAVEQFFLLLIKKNQNAMLKNGWIITKNQSFCCFFDEKTTKTSAISEQIAKCPTPNNELVALGIGFEPEAVNLKIKLVDGTGVYALMKQQKIFPKTSTICTKTKFAILKTAFARKNFTKYFFLSLIFSFSAIFVPYKKLYFAFSILTAIFAIISITQKEEDKNAFLLN